MLIEHLIELVYTGEKHSVHNPCELIPSPVPRSQLPSFPGFGVGIKYQAED